MDAQRSIYPQRAQRKSFGQFRGLSRKLRESMRFKATALENGSMLRPWNIAACGGTRKQQHAAALEYNIMRRPRTITSCGGPWNSEAQECGNSELKTQKSEFRI